MRANRDAVLLEDLLGGIDRFIVAAVPGLEQDALLLLGVGDEVVELADGRRRRLFHQHVLARIDRLAHIGVAHPGGVQIATSFTSGIAL